MKLRRELWLVPVVAGGVWLALEARPTRAGRELELAKEERTNPPPVEAPAIVTLQTPALPAKADEGAVRTGEAAARTRIPVPSSPPAALDPDPTASLSRGRLVDELTLEPIPDALVVAGDRHDWTDADGRFDTGEPLDAHVEVLVLNVARNTNTHEVPRERWTRLADGWQVPLAIGPTYRLHLLGLESPTTGSWEGRLMQGGREEGWLALCDGPRPYLRYDAPIVERDRGGHPWVEVRSRDGLHEGRGEVLSLTGVQEVDVACRARAVLRGRVVDEGGAPCDGIGIQAALLHEDGVERFDARTAADGHYQLSAAEPGSMRVVFLLPLETARRELKLRVPSGVTLAPDVVLARSLPAGTIGGLLRCRSGAEQIDATVRLRALDGSRYEQVCRLGLRSGLKSTRPAIGVVVTSDDVQALRLRLQREGISVGDSFTVPDPRTRPGEFLFESVPPGRFELSVVSEQGFSWSPSALEVQAPANGLVFICDDELSLRSYHLEVVDAESGAPISPITAVARVEGALAEQNARPKRGETRIELAEDARFEWSVTSPGYRLGHGNERDFRLRDGVPWATCALRRGFGVRLLLQDRCGTAASAMSRQTTTYWAPEGIAGVEILADGVPVATSDERGIAELDLPAEPRRIEVRLAGWRVLDSPWFRDGKVQGFPRAQVWMVRE